MDTKSIWDMLAGISMGTVVAWIIVLSTILTIVSSVAIRLYRLFSKYKNLKDENEEQKKLLQEHEQVLSKIDKTLESIKLSLDEQRDVNLKQIRHVIVDICSDAIKDEYIGVNKLRILEEMYSEYVDVFHGNGYVKTLVSKVRKLPVKGEIIEE